MKITVIPTGNAPTHYAFDGELITAYHDQETESFDLSVIPADGEFKGVLADTVNLPSSQILRNAYRDSAGELHVTLCQKVGSGHWESGSEIDVTAYEADKIHVVYNADKAHAGTPTVVTSTGTQELS